MLIISILQGFLIVIIGLIIAIICWKRKKRIESSTTSGSTESFEIIQFPDSPNDPCPTTITVNTYNGMYVDDDPFTQDFTVSDEYFDQMNDISNTHIQSVEEH